jgi:hypothetical protein
MRYIMNTKSYSKFQNKDDIVSDHGFDLGLWYVKILFGLGRANTLLAPMDTCRLFFNTSYSELILILVNILIK